MQDKIAVLGVSLTDKYRTYGSNASIPNYYYSGAHSNADVSSTNNGTNSWETNGADIGNIPTFAFSHPSLRTAVATAACIWFAGMLGLLAHCAISYLRLHRSLAQKAVYSRLYKNICVYEVAGLDTPFVAGLAKPMIYLPEGLEEWESRQCLAHEYTHIRRKDYLIKQAAYLLACVYWFQPLVWLAFHLMSKDMEMSCDEMTLRDADLKDRKAYSAALVRLSSETTRFSGCPLAFSENNTSSRIKNILNLKKPAVWITVACSVLLVAFTVGLLTNPSGTKANAGGDHSAQYIADSALSGSLLYDPPVSVIDKVQSESGDTILTGLAADKAAAGGNASPEEQQKPAPLDETAEAPPENSLENPYPTIIQTAFQDLQTAYRENNTEEIRSLQLEMKMLMTSYWTALVKEKRIMEKEINQLTNSHYGPSSSEEEIEAIFERQRLLENMVDQANNEMDYMTKTIHAIEGSANMVKAADYETDYPLYGTLPENDTIVRSLPKESAPQVDTLTAGDIVTVISFGKYMLQEDENFSDFLQTDEEIRQEYRNFAVVLYQPEGKTTRKGYINIDALDISGNTAETYMYWIGKTWSEAFCSQDGAALYQMAADKKSFMEWDYVNGILDTFPVQVELNTSNHYPQQFYHVSLLTDKAPEGLSPSGDSDIALQFFVQTPEPGVWIQRQDLKYAGSSRQLQNISHIEDLQNQAVYFSEIRNYEQVTSCSEYRDAYLAAYESGPSYFDFKGSGYTAVYNSDDLIRLINRTMSSYALETAGTMLEKYLNLSGGSAQADAMTLRLRDGERITGLTQLAYVEYTFAQADENGQNKIAIPLYCDENGNWCIWRPGENDALDAAICRMRENMSLSTP